MAGVGGIKGKHINFRVLRALRGYGCFTLAFCITILNYSAVFKMPLAGESAGSRHLGGRL